MNKIGQKAAVVALCLAQYQEQTGEEFVMNGDVNMKDSLSDQSKATIREQLFAQSREGLIEYKQDFIDSKLNDDSELKKYVSGLLNNHLRKTKEFNGGNVYVPKNPGSRQHSSDEQMKNLKALRAQTVAAGDTDGTAQVDEAIEARKSELAAAKAKTIEIDVSKIPDSLKHLVTSTEESTEEA